MKIAVDARVLLDGRYSGVSWYAYQLLEALLARDQKNDYIFFYNASKRHLIPDWIKSRAAAADFKYPNKLFNFSLKILAQPKLDRLLGGCDCFFMPNLNFFALSDKARLVLTIHDLAFKLFPEFYTPKGRLWHRLVFAPAVRRADTIVAVSENTKKDLLALTDLAPEKVRVVYEGVSPKFRPLPPESLSAVKNKYNLPDDYFLFLGNLEPRKNLLSVIEAFNLLPDKSFNLIIAGEGAQKSQAQKLANENQRVRFIGYVAEEDKPALYNLAACLVYPSYYEGFGLPLAEAMACGTPVIYGANSAPSELAGAAGLAVNPYNINEIKAAMLALRSDGNLRQDLSARGLERAKKFSWDSAARQMLEIWDNK